MFVERAVNIRDILAMDPDDIRRSNVLDSIRAVFGDDLFEHLKTEDLPQSVAPQDLATLNERLARLIETMQSQHQEVLKLQHEQGKAGMKGVAIGVIATLVIGVVGFALTIALELGGA